VEALQAGSPFAMEECVRVDGAASRSYSAIFSSRVLAWSSSPWTVTFSVSPIQLSLVVTFLEWAGPRAHTMSVS
jgi:hypothetical protein